MNHTNFAVHDSVRCDCYRCTKRTVGCHDTCEQYKKFRDELSKVRQRERAEQHYKGASSWVYIHGGKDKW